MTPVMNHALNDGVCSKLAVSNQWKDDRFKTYNELELKLIGKKNELEMVEYIIQSHAHRLNVFSKEYTDIATELETLKTDVDKLEDEMYRILLENDSLIGYREYMEFREDIGLKEYGYRAGCHTGQQQKKYVKTKNKMFEYLKNNIDEELAGDWLKLMGAYSWFCLIVHTKWTQNDYTATTKEKKEDPLHSLILDYVKNKDGDLIELFCGKISEFIKVYYWFVEKYRTPGGRGKINYGFKIHTVRHIIPWIRYNRISPAIVDEQQGEHLHILINTAFNIYRNTKGKDQIRCIVRYVLMLCKHHK